MKRLLLLAGLCLMLPGGAFAQKTAPKKPAVKAPVLPLKTAAQVLDASAKASGAAAAAKVKSTVVTGKISVPAQGLTGSMTMKSKGDKFVLTQSLPNFGDIVVGYDGKVGWSKDPINSLRELKGDELAQARQEADLGAEPNWRKKYKAATLMPARKVGTALCYVVRVTPMLGPPSTQYIDAKSLLLLRTDMIAVSPNGKIPTETYVSDYRTVDGMKIPFRTRSIVAGVQEVIVTFDKVENNVPVDDAEFAKPKEAPAAKP